jgi:hypothetical protein
VAKHNQGKANEGLQVAKGKMELVSLQTIWMRQVTLGNDEEVKLLLMSMMR